MPETLQQIRTRFRWDPETLRYRREGKFVSSREVKDALVRYLETEQNVLRILAGKMARGEITISDWQLQTAELVKNIQIAAYAIARGGIHQITKGDYGKIGSRLKYQYTRLRSFALKVQRRLMTAKAILTRAELYAASAASTYENLRRERAVMVYTEERRVLAAAEHCDVCEDEADKGWVPAGTLKEIGDSPCRMRCLCHFEYQKPGEEG